jgi:hypothetical protein
MDQEGSMSTTPRWTERCSVCRVWVEDSEGCPHGLHKWCCREHAQNGGTMSSTYTRTDGREVERLTTAETAKIVRAALKRRFPEVRFSVRSQVYSGGSSIHVSWADGPTEPQVREVTQPLTGADFDGMIDLKTYRDPVETIDGRLVSMGADFIPGQRGFTREWICKAWELYDAQKPSNVDDTDPFWGFSSWLRRTEGPHHTERVQTTYDYSRP